MKTITSQITSEYEDKSEKTCYCSNDDRPIFWVGLCRSTLIIRTSFPDSVTTSPFCGVLNGKSRGSWFMIPTPGGSWSPTGLENKNVATLQGILSARTLFVHDAGRPRLDVFGCRDRSYEFDHDWMSSEQLAG